MDTVLIYIIILLTITNLLVQKYFFSIELLFLNVENPQNKKNPKNKKENFQNNLKIPKINRKFLKKNSKTMVVTLS